MDFFNDPNTFNMTANPVPGTANVPTANIGSILANPAVQTMAFNLAAALDPDGFGGRLAKAGLAMRQAQSVAKGMTKAQTPQVQQPSAPASVPAPNTNLAVNPLDTAKQYTKLGSLMKEAFALNPSLVPDGYSTNLTNALTMNSNNVANPTQPVGSDNVGQPTGATPMPTALELDPALAMSMTPEQVQNIFTQNTAREHLNLARRAQDVVEKSLPYDLAAKQAEVAHTYWGMDPARVEETIRINTAPVLAQLDVYKGKQGFDLANSQDFIANNPKVASVKLPGGTTIGQQLLLDAASPGGARNAADLVRAGLEYEATKIRVAAEIQHAKIQAASTGQDRLFSAQMALVEKYNKDILAFEKGMSVDDWNKLTPEQQMNNRIMGIIPQTSEMQKARDFAIQQRDDILARWAPSYNKLSAYDSSKQPPLIRAVIEAESSGVNGQKSSAGAMGLMQLMPATMQQYGVTNPYDPVQNIRAGSSYLYSLIQKYKGDERKALAAYNWGPANVDKYGYAKAPQSVRDYVERVLTLKKQYSPKADLVADPSKLAALQKETQRKKVSVSAPIGSVIKGTPPSLSRQQIFNMFGGNY